MLYEWQMLDNITFCHGIHGTCPCTHTHTHTHIHIYEHHTHSAFGGWFGVGGVCVCVGGGDFCIDLPYYNTIDPCSEKSTLQGYAQRCTHVNHCWRCHAYGGGLFNTWSWCSYSRPSRVFSSTTIIFLYIHTKNNRRMKWHRSQLLSAQNKWRFSAG